MKRGKQHEGQLARLTTLGGLLGIKTSTLLPRLAPLSAACDEHMLVTVTHAFDSLAVSTRVSRALAQPLCPWLDALPGDDLSLVVDAATITAFSDEAALPDGAPAAAAALADDLAALGFDGTTWTFAFDQDNASDTAAVLARIDSLARTCGVTDAQRRIAAELHGGLARGMTSRLSLRAHRDTLEPTLALAWDRVEWTPLQSMLRGFYPRGQGVERVARLSRAIDADTATVELVLGPSDPPGVRFTFEV